MFFNDTTASNSAIIEAAKQTDSNIAIVSVYALGNGGIESYRSNCNVTEGGVMQNSLRCTNDNKTFLMKLKSNGIDCQDSFMGKQVVREPLVPSSATGKNTSWIRIAEALAQYNSPVISASQRCTVSDADVGN